MSVSYEEKSVWVQLISLLVVIGGYLVVAGLMRAQGASTLIGFVPLFGAAVVLLVVVLIVGHILAVIGCKPEGRDERDRLIRWRAESSVSWVLGAGVVLAVTGMVFSVDNVWVAHLLLLSMLLSEVLKLVMQLVYYRRGV